MDLLGEDPEARATRLLVQLGEVFLISADVGLPVRVLQDLDLVQRPLYVLLRDASPPTQVV